jgi:alpha-mannosidase
VLRVAGDLPWVECRTVLENCALDHRLRLHVPLGAPAETAVVDGHFAVTERPASPPAPQADWKQQPPPSNHCESLAAIAASDGSGRGVALLTRGLHEYEVTGADLSTRHAPGGRLELPIADAALELTLLRAVGFLSRDDIAGRPGHAGPSVETPGAQCIGGHELEFAILPFAGDSHAAGLARAARRFAAPPLAIAPVNAEIATCTGHEARVRDLLGTASTFDLPQPVGVLERMSDHGLRIDGAVELSALTRADDGSGDVVLRVFNPTREGAPVRVQLPEGVASASWVRLDERPVAGSEQFDVEGGELAFDVPAGAVRTLRLGLAS